MIKEELFVIIRGERKQLDIETPSGITLRFLSNMFNDLSKFSASYSYTFKLPKTSHNVDVFDLVDDVRYNSSIYGKRIECEYLQDGIVLFNNSYLYISESGEDYSAVMTWNVLSWLKQVEEDGKSIRDLESELSGEELSTVVFKSDPFVTTDIPQSMGSKSIDARYLCGTRYISSSNPPLIPVRYLLEKIAQKYGYKGASDVFSFLRDTPLTNIDFDEANGNKFNIFEDGVIPLVSGKWSNRYLQTQIRRSDKLRLVKYKSSNKELPMVDSNGNTWESGVQASNGVLYLPNNVYFLTIGDMSGSQDYVKLFRATGTATSLDSTLDISNTNWKQDNEQTGMYIGFSPVNRNISLKLRGMIRTTNPCTLKVIKFVEYFALYGIKKYQPKYSDDGDMEDVIEVSSREVEGVENLWELNFDPENGGSEIEIKPSLDYAFYVVQIQNIGENFITDGYVKFIPERDNISLVNRTPDAINIVDLFSNLPDIKIIDLLKSLFYVENSYPIIGKDGRIGITDYKELYRNIESGNVYDWSKYIIDEPEKDSLKYTTGTLARINRFNMKNYSTSDNNGEESPEKYDVATAYFSTENNTLDLESTVYTFPYASAALVTKFGNYAGGTLMFWGIDEKTNEYKPNSSVQPIIGRVRMNKRAVYFQSLYVAREMKMDIWQVKDRNYQGSVLASILRKPFVVTTRCFLDATILSVIDYAKPVYLERYNSYFGIVYINMGSNGVSKVELIKLPPVVDMTEGETSIPEIQIDAPSVIYKSSAIRARADVVITSKINNATIDRMVVKLDGETIMDGSFEEVSFEKFFEAETHVIEATAYASNGKSVTDTKEIRVLFAAEDISIDFINNFYRNYTITQTKRNSETITVAAYNYEGIRSFTLYVYEKGKSNKQIIAQGTTSVISGEWEYFKQLSRTLWEVTYVMEAEFVDTNGKKILFSKEVYVKTGNGFPLFHPDDYADNPVFFITDDSGNRYDENQTLYQDFDQNFGGDFAIEARNFNPYYVIVHFKYYRQDGTFVEKDHCIDPFYGNTEYISFDSDDIAGYTKIEVSATGWFYDDESTIYRSGTITIQNQK